MRPMHVISDTSVWGCVWVGGGVEALDGGHNCNISNNYFETSGQIQSTTTDMQTEPLTTSSGNFSNTTELDRNVFIYFQH